MWEGASCPSQDLCTGGDSTTTSTTTASSTTVTTTTTVASASGKLVVHQQCENGIRASGTYTVQVCPPATQDVTNVTCSAGDSFTIGAGLVVERIAAFVDGNAVTCRTPNPGVADGELEWNMTATCEQGCPVPGAAAAAGVGGHDDSSNDTSLDSEIIFAIIGGALALAALLACGLLRYSAVKAAELERSKGQRWASPGWHEIRDIFAWLTSLVMSRNMATTCTTITVVVRSHRSAPDGLLFVGIRALLDSIGMRIAQPFSCMLSAGLKQLVCDPLWGCRRCCSQG
mmetsp:Transcript_25772/g.66424  ORF Transcript_25772/g.66424 Transcript_25772/m.66424 type:complete len:286 (+) Transcript_25772:111-968(+)